MGRYRGPTVTSTDYPDDGLPHGGVGVVGSFTFDSGDRSVDAYRWGLTFPPATRVETVSGEPRTIQLAPPTFGTNILYVQAVAGNELSPITEYNFLVAVPSSPLGHWLLEADIPGLVGQELADQTGRGRTLVSSPGLSWQPDARLVTAATAGFDGSTAFARTDEPVVDTSASFSVAAWVRLTDNTVRRTVLSQEGTRGVGFALAYAPGTNRWVFEMYSADVDQPVVTRVVSPTPVRLGFWTHLAATYDAAAGQLLLYVDGTLVTTAPHVNTWSATGPFVVGRARRAGADARYWAGNIADVYAWDRPFVPDDLPPILRWANVGLWPFDGDCCGEALDGERWNRSLLLTATGAEFVFDPERGGVLQLDGVTGAAASTTPVLRTDQPFTVATWVRLDALPGGDRCALSQDGGQVSGLCLGVHRAAGALYWALTMKAADSQGGPTDVVRATTRLTAAAVGDWVHLAGVFDPVDRQLRLYVDGEQAGTATRSAAWQAGGPLAAGRGRRSGTPALYWPGAVDTVRVYAGVLSDADIRALSS